MIIVYIASQNIYVIHEIWQQQRPVAVDLVKFSTCYFPFLTTLALISATPNIIETMLD